MEKIDGLIKDAVNTQCPEKHNFLLEPCPFCGSDGVASVHPEIDTMHIAGCSDADCIAAYVAYDFTSRDTAIAAWNRRALTGEAEPVAKPGVISPLPRRKELTMSEAVELERMDRLAIIAICQSRLPTWELLGVDTKTDIFNLVAALTGEVEPVVWPDREAVARALHARYEERARQRGQIGGDGYTVLGGARLEDCSRSLRQSFLEDADAVLSLLSGGGSLSILY